MSDPVESARLDGLRAAGYELQSLIGRGGMAYVYRAEDTRLGRVVAVKVLAPELAQNDEFRQRFLRESRLAASLDHPNIIPIYEAGEADGHLYLAMRYVEGADLKVVLKRRGTLTVDETMALFGQVGAALDAAHQAGLVHRDVKPANILVSAATTPAGRDHVYLSDFGLTKRASSLTGVTATGIVVGTMDYVAPEQIGGKAVDARTDVYALGCVLYQALTGKVPFIRDDDAALLWAHLMEMPTPVSSVRPEIPVAVDQVIATAMAKGPEGRFASCGDFIAALGAAFGGQQVNLPASASGGPGVSPNSAPPATHPEPPQPPTAQTPTPQTQTPTPQPPTPHSPTSVPPSGPITQPPVPGWSAPPSTGAAEQPHGTPLPTAQYPGNQYPGNQYSPSSAPPHGTYPNQYSPTQFPPSGYPHSAPPHPQSAPPNQAMPHPYSAPPHQGSAPPYPYSAPPHPGSAPPYPYSAPPHGVGSTPPPTPDSGRGRKLLIGGLAGALVLAVVLVLVLVIKPFEEGTKHFDPTTTLPISFDYPESWNRSGQGTNLVFSPKASDAAALFTAPGTGTGWPKLADALKSDADSVVGVYTLLSLNPFPDEADGRKESLQGQLPTTANLGAEEPTVVDGHDSARYDGELQQDGGDAELRIRCFVTTDQTTNQTVVLVFFASEKAWSENEDKFKTLLGSVKFSA
ncbi:serine/threonine-protein kinase [Cryptosporangium aurantiacum]|uniref:non-specific serine/threonine protein kinase n=1 Tax=Cryptosporangium aurantiacum TaxID=134849 RepID=A0A1M7QXR7_9ACTN|nr:serine/threonine-protein kinase [Cryptosporangium aurantiacum]SHN36819.1 Serine/threonine protein kinase [Cryptosporangium aurantiacum]